MTRSTDPLDQARRDTELVARLVTLLCVLIAVGLVTYSLVRAGT